MSIHWYQCIFSGITSHYSNMGLMVSRWGDLDCSCLHIEVQLRDKCSESLGHRLNVLNSKQWRGSFCCCCNSRVNHLETLQANLANTSLSNLGERCFSSTHLGATGTHFPRPAFVLCGARRASCGSFGSAMVAIVLSFVLLNVLPCPLLSACKLH